MPIEKEQIKTVKWVKDLIDTSKNQYMILTDNNDKKFSVPLDEGNTDYQTIQEWVAEGNTIEEAD
tara:strand:- start:3 stop:197 length:195 start_codon:yes stop_codon:yes gene_type:complete